MEIINLKIRLLKNKEGENCEDCCFSSDGICRIPPDINLPDCIDAHFEWANTKQKNSKNHDKSILINKEFDKYRKSKEYAYIFNQLWRCTNTKDSILGVIKDIFVSGQTSIKDE